jgi:hypothetical protein
MASAFRRLETLRAMNAMLEKGEVGALSRPAEETEERIHLRARISLFTSDKVQEAIGDYDRETLEA